jgi:hypothetical protein
MGNLIVLNYRILTLVMKNLNYGIEWKGLNLTIVLKNFEQINARRLLLIVTRGVYFWRTKTNKTNFNTDSRKTRDL